jgi:hypothetical protein
MHPTRDDGSFTFARKKFVMSTIIGRSWLVRVTLTLAVMATSSPALGGSALLSDCSSACGGTPSGSECTTACNNNNCPGSWSWSAPDQTVQRCSYTSSFTPGIQGAWVPGTTRQFVCDCCSTLTCNGASATDSFTENATATVSATYSGSVQASINGGLVGVTAGLEVKEEFTLGSTSSSSVEITASHTGNLNPGACGKKRGYLVMFTASRPASGTLTFSFEGVCRGCSNPTNEWVTVKSCNKSVSLTGSNKAWKWTECDLACTNVPNEACTTSATSNTTPCNYNVYP